MCETLHRLWTWYPPVGVFIGILGLLAAIVPFFRDLGTIGKKEKAFWTIVMFGLVLLEVHSIYLDRDAHDREQTEARERQVEQFRTIALGIDTEIKTSQQQFDATMGKLQKTLEASQGALKNSEPYAALGYEGVRVYIPSLPMAVGRRLSFNVSFTNNGTDVARNPNREARMYVRRPDNVEDQKQIGDDFDEQWKRSTHVTANNIRPRDPVMFTFDSDLFTQSEVNGVLNHTLTLYVLIRFTWTDRTGNWVSDECFSFQDPTHDFDVGHKCQFHNDPRHRAK